MKAAILNAAVIASSLFNLSAYAQGTCNLGAGTQPGVGTVGPYAPVYDPNSPGYPTGGAQPAVYPAAVRTVSPNQPAAGSAPSARITVLNATPPCSANGTCANSEAPVGRLTVVPAGPVSETKTDAADLNDVIANITPESSAAPAATAAVAEPATDMLETAQSALKSLVGTWRAVARVGDGELTTFELQLDDRGWATISVPGADGKPYNSKRKVELENDELKLNTPNAEFSLGKLIEVSDRQFVVARSDGEFTFVRP